MKISGSSTLEAPVDKVWEAIQDPAVLARCLPGCESLAVIGDGPLRHVGHRRRRRHQGHVCRRGVAVRQGRPSSLTMRASGRGRARHHRRRRQGASSPRRPAAAPTSPTTPTRRWAGRSAASASGCSPGSTKKMAGQFFTALDRDIAGLTPRRRAGRTARRSTAGAAAGGPASGAVYPGRAATANANATLNLDNGAGFAVGVLVGGLLALAGAAVGFAARRR